MTTPLRLAAIMLAGCLVGLLSAWWAVDDPRFDFTREVGPWRAVAAAVDTDPYGLARAAREGAIGLGGTEGLTLTALTDSAGRPLSPTCFYRIEGPLPKDALWTITIADRNGDLPANPADRVGFSAYDALHYDPGARIIIGLGPYPRPGDFVPLAGLDRPKVVLRLYSQAWASRAFGAGELPAIIRDDCRGEERT